MNICLGSGGVWRWRLKGTARRRAEFGATVRRPCDTMRLGKSCCVEGFSDARNIPWSRARREGGGSGRGAAVAERYGSAGNGTRLQTSRGGIARRPARVGGGSFAVE